MGESEETHQPTTNYDELQTEELGSLQAIYMDDFEEIQVKGAWSKSSDKAFRLHLKALSDPDTSIVLSVRFTATYPKSLPILSVEKHNGIRERFRKAIDNILQTKPKELLGEVMIYELAATIQDILEDEAHHKADGDALPTLEEERAKHEADVAEAAEQAAEQDKIKQFQQREQEKAEEDRLLQQMVEEELIRRKQQREKSKPPLSTLPSSTQIYSNANQTITFDRVIRFQNEIADITFTAVDGCTKLAEGPVTTVRTVRPVVGDNSVSTVPFHRRYSGMSTLMIKDSDYWKCERYQTPDIFPDTNAVLEYSSR